MASNPCGLNGVLHTGTDKTQLTPGGEKSIMRTLSPGKDEKVAIDKVTGSGKNKVTESVQKSVLEAVREYVIASNEIASASEKKEDAAAALRIYVKDIRDTNAYAGDYQKTYRVAGTVGNSGVQFGAAVAHQDRFSIPKKEVDIAALKDLVGKDFFNGHFSKDIQISIKKEVMENKDLRKELTQKLVDAFGVDGIKKYFNKEEVWSVKEGLDKAQYDLDKDTRAKFAEKCKQYADQVTEACFDPKNTL
jgi:hypothetical protein